MMFLEVQNADPGILGTLLQQYGIMGLVFGVLLTLILRQNKAASKRIEQLEESNDEQHIKNIEALKETINQYVDLVKHNTQVLSDLTSCLRAMKETIDRFTQK